MIGPPALTVYWLVFLQSIGVGLGLPVSGSRLLLLSQLLADSAVLRTFQTAAPLNWFVPVRVRTWTCPFPRPNSASTGDIMTRISPTKSGFMVVVPERTLFRVSVTLRPSLVVLMVLVGRPVKVLN